MAKKSMPKGGEGVVETAPNPEQAEQIRSEAQKVNRDLVEEIATSDFMKSLNLPGIDQNQLEGDLEADRKQAENKAEEEQAKEEEILDNIVKEQEAQEEPEASSEEDEEDEDMVPMSKFKKRVDSLTAQLKAMEAKLEAAEETKAAKSDDPDLAKLRDMSTSELRTLRRQILKEAKRTDDDATEDRLYELLDKVDDTIHTAPKRVQEKTQKLYNKAAQQVMNDPDLDGHLDKLAPKIMEKANAIYSRSKSMQNRVEGQAEALLLAAESVKEISKLSTGKLDTKALKRENNKLKKKTSLDAKVMKGDFSKTDLARSREKAKNAYTVDDKLDYALKSGIIRPPKLY